MIAGTPFLRKPSKCRKSCITCDFRVIENTGYSLLVVSVTAFITIKLTIGALTEKGICGIIIDRLTYSQVIKIAR